jgi:phosphoglycerate dehydrogenase-like enzyme
MPCDSQLMDGFRVGVTRETFLPFGLEPLERAGVEWELLAEEVPELTPTLVAGYDALFHFSVRVSAASLEGADRLALIARHGVGLDMIDLDACTRRGIAVTITPDAIRRPIASAAVALVLALAHRLVERNEAFHDGRWAEGRFGLMGTGLTGRTLGVIGLGNIGREIVRLLEPYGMLVLATTRRRLDEAGVEQVDLETLLREADVVVVSCPLTPETHHLLDARRLALMKPTALLVNVARGPIVDQAALAEALRAGRLAGAGLDVFEQEPVPPGDPLLGQPNVVAAPHALGYTDELFRGCVASACSAILAVREGRVPEHVANPEVLDRADFRAKLERLDFR